MAATEHESKCALVSTNSHLERPQRGSRTLMCSSHLRTCGRQPPAIDMLNREASRIPSSSDAEHGGSQHWHPPNARKHQSQRDSLSAQQGRGKRATARDEPRRTP